MKYVTTTIVLKLESTTSDELHFMNRCSIQQEITNAALKLNISNITNMIDLTKKLYPVLRSMYPAAPAVDIQQCTRRAAAITKAHFTRINRLQQKYEWFLQHASNQSFVTTKLQKLIRHLTNIRPLMNKPITTITLTNQQYRLDAIQQQLFLTGFLRKQYLNLSFKISSHMKQQLQFAILGECQICQHKNKKWYAHIAIRRMVDLKLDKIYPVMGVDIGIVNLVATSEGDIIPGANIWKKYNNMEHQRSALKAINTRSSRRKLRKISGRQCRYINDVLHCVSKWVVTRAIQLNVKFLSLERIKIIPILERNQHLRQLTSHWPFSKLLSYIHYKAELAGITVYYDHAAHTSTTCHKCGYRDKKNRLDQATFHCQMCGYTANADINAALNLQERGFKRLLQILQFNGSL